MYVQIYNEHVAVDLFDYFCKNFVLQLFHRVQSCAKAKFEEKNIRTTVFQKHYKTI